MFKCIHPSVQKDKLMDDDSTTPTSEPAKTPWILLKKFPTRSTL